MIVPILKELGHDCRGWAIYTNGGIRVVNGETFVGWGVNFRSSHGRIYVMFGPVVTTGAHLAFSGARTHSNNTAEMTAMIEALSFLGPRGPVTHDERSRFLMVLSCCWYLSLHDPSPHTCAARLWSVCVLNPSPPLPKKSQSEAPPPPQMSMTLDLPPMSRTTPGGGGGAKKCQSEGGGRR